jgi:hypothetical protein
VVVGALCGIAVVLGLSLRAYYNWSKDDWRSGALLLAQDTHADHAIETVSQRYNPILLYYQPELGARIVAPWELAAEATGTGTVTRVWWVWQREGLPPALEDRQRRRGWKAIRVDVSPTLYLFYSGESSEQELWCEVAELSPPATVIAEAGLPERVAECKDAQVKPMWEGVDAALRGYVSPPLLAAQRAKLEAARGARR